MNNIEMKRSDQSVQILMTFLESSACPPYTMNFYQLDGYLRAQSCSSLLPSDDDWFPLIFGDERPAYQDEEQALQIRSHIFQLFRFHQQQVQTNQCDLPVAASYSANRQERMDIEQWARGFLQGYIFREEHWNNLLECVPLNTVDGNITTESVADEMDAVLYIVSTVADADLAVMQGTSHDALDGIFESLPAALIRFSRLTSPPLANLQLQTDTANGIV